MTYLQDTSVGSAYLCCPLMIEGAALRLGEEAVDRRCLREVSVRAQWAIRSDR